MDDLPPNKYKAILSNLRKASETEPITGKSMASMARVHNVDLDAVRAIAGMENIRVFSEPSPEPKVKKARTSVKVREDIKNGTIFKLMRKNSGTPDDDTIVVSTYGQLRRERQAMLEWMQDVRDGVA
jgi:hypothetical protein